MLEDHHHLPEFLMIRYIFFIAWVCVFVFTFSVDSHWRTYSGCSLSISMLAFIPLTSSVSLLCKNMQLVMYMFHVFPGQWGGAPIQKGRGCLSESLKKNL